MQLHTLKRIHKNKKKAYVGRGGKRGKTSGKGTKGQKSRAGRKIRPEIRDMIKRIPKLRGRGKNLNMSIQKKPVALSLAQIEKVYKAGETVSPVTLFTKGLLLKEKGLNPRVKIVGNTGLTKKLTFSKVTLTEGAKKMVTDLGGTL